MDEYRYSIGMLKRIASCYKDIYSGIPATRETNCSMGEVIVFALCKDLDNSGATRGELADLLHRTDDVTNLFSIAEYKADFDRALSSIGRGEWKGLASHNFNDYSDFGKQQRAVIADILEITDRQLETWGIYQVRKLRHKAYKKMAAKLSGEKFNGRGDISKSS